MVEVKREIQQVKSSHFTFRRVKNRKKKETLNVTEGGVSERKKGKSFVRKRKDVNEENKKKRESRL